MVVEGRAGWAGERAAGTPADLGLQITLIGQRHVVVPPHAALGAGRRSKPTAGPLVIGTGLGVSDGMLADLALSQALAQLGAHRRQIGDPVLLRHARLKDIVV